ncbi:MAG: leucine-rich repeat protein [Oscillospiraceae bacterium]|nr:leucine-rich repeat protein [Oscillospiraceae bacterium]
MNKTTLTRIVCIVIVSAIILPVILFAVMFAAGGTAGAAAEEYPMVFEVTKDGLWGYKIEEGKAAITGYFGDESEITTPGNIDGVPVIAIGDYVFDRNYGLVEVTISEGIESIGNNAFADCNSLVRLSMPSSIKSIGVNAFLRCEELKSVIFPPGFESIGNYAFSFCRELENVDLPEGMLYIGEEAFESCVSLRNITIPGSVVNLRSGVFADCSGLQNVTISPGVRSIGDRAFNNCSSIVNMIIPDSVISIGENAFYGCANLSGIVIPKSVTSIGALVFEECDKLTIHCFENSTAHGYAVNNGIRFFLITENIPVTGISLNRNTLSLTVRQTGTLAAAITPVNATNRTVTWASSNNNVATVAGGIVTARAAGTVTITARVGDKTAVCTVTVQNIPGFNITARAGTGGTAIGGGTFYQGTTVTLRASASKGFAFGGWFESGKKISSKTTYTFSAAKARTLQAQFKAIKVKSVKLNRKSIELGLKKNRRFQLRATITPANARNQRVVWKSSNPRIAAVSQTGRVTARKRGTTTITVTTRDGKKTRTCRVRIS